VLRVSANPRRGDACVKLLWNVICITLVLMRKCKKCLLPETVPGSEIDVSGLCSFCRQHTLANRAEADMARRHHEADLEKTLRTVHGQGDYDCLVNLSGGKDSCLLLHRVRNEYGLRVLAFTTDINIPEVAWENIRRTLQKVDVDHVVYKPPREFYRKLYRFLLQNQEERGAVRTVCYVCAPLYEGYALQLAVEKNVPLVLAGYSPGQPEPERMVYEFSREVIEKSDWTPPEVHNSGLFSEDELSHFWNPFRYRAGTVFPRYLAPFHAWHYSQEENIRKVVELGLIRNSTKASPVHSNCPLNWLLMYSDLKHLGYNPYAPEFSKLIRDGKASRTYWKVMGPVVNTMIRTNTFLGKNVRDSLRSLDLKPEDLKITRSATSKGEFYPGRKPS
jgi:hypothetical protein